MAGPCGANEGDREVIAAMYAEIGELDLRTAMAAMAVVHGDGAGVVERRVVG